MAKHRTHSLEFKIDLRCQALTAALLLAELVGVARRGERGSVKRRLLKIRRGS